MKMLWRLFKKNKKSNRYKSESDIYSHMGTLGVSPTHMKMYQDSINNIKKYKNSIQE